MAIVRNDKNNFMKVEIKISRYKEVKKIQNLVGHIFQGASGYSQGIYIILIVLLE